MKEWIAGVLAAIIAGVVVVWLTTTPVTPPRLGHMSELRWGVNLQGSDIANLDNSRINTEGACSNACQENSACKSMTFVKHPSGVGGICWLKDAIPPSSSNKEMTSAVKMFP